MNEIQLYDKRGSYFVTVKIDRNLSLPNVILHKDKYYVWGSATQHYREGTLIEVK